MMEQGTLTISFKADDTGALTALVMFTPTGATDGYSLADGLPVGDGEAITVYPTCVCCTLDTTVTSGTGLKLPAAAHSATRPAAAATRPAAAPATRPAAGGGKPHA